jgi:hypothetical protein
VGLPQVIKSFQNYRGVATTFYPTLVNPHNGHHGITMFSFFYVRGYFLADSSSTDGYEQQSIKK